MDIPRSLDYIIGPIRREMANDPEKFCEAMDEWAALIMNKASGRIVSRDEFTPAWQTVRLAISKSCLLSRTLYGGEKPSQTPCPVHNGVWSGCHFGHISQEWIDAGCRCSQHRACDCTTGWQPDEHCGCVETEPVEEIKAR